VLAIVFRIRSSVASAASSSVELPFKQLPEEVACLALVAEAEKWLNKVKKTVQVMNLALLNFIFEIIC
jgi:hypothetical protein